MLRTPTKKIISLFFVIFLALVVFAISNVSQASINSQINFQGKLTNPDGTNVTNGNYSIDFSIYTVSSGGSSTWTETQSVAVADGIFNVQLGSVNSLPGSVDFNSSSLYLGIKVGSDAEMTPRVRLTAAPYAFNSTLFSGLATTDFVQLAQGMQTDASAANPSIAINKTGGTAKILQLQRSGADVLSVNNDGSAVFTNQTDTTSGFQVQTAAGTTIVNIDTTNQQLSVRNKTDAASLGSDIFSASGTGTNWSGTNPYTHTSGSTAVLQFSSPAITANTTYQIDYTTTGLTTGKSFTPSIGGVDGEPIFGNVTNQTQLITTTGTADFTITPTSTSAGTLTINSLKIVSNSTSALAIKNSSNVVKLEVRSDDTNTGLGLSSLQSNISGTYNTAEGAFSLRSNTTGSNNTANGNYSLSANTTGSNNTSTGALSLSSNISGNNNTSEGYGSLQANTTGSNNTSSGYQSLLLNTTGSNNTSFGYLSLKANTSGTNNTAIGYQSLFYNTTGSNNTAVGFKDETGDGSFREQATIKYATSLGAAAVVQQDNSLVLGRVGDGSTSSTTGQTKVGIGTTIPLNTFSVSPVYYNVGTAYQSGSTITGVGTTWTNSMEGMQLIFSNGETAIINSVDSSTSITASVSQTVSSTPGLSYRIHTPGFNVTNSGNAYIQNSNTSAFSVLDSSGVNALNVDTVNGNITADANLIIDGSQLTNNGSTLLAASALSNYASNGSLGSAASTVDVHSGFTIPQTTSSITLTIPSPTDTSAGRVIYISNTGSASFTVDDVSTLNSTINPNTTTEFLWNGSGWTSSGGGAAGVTSVGSFDSQTPNGNGATIIGAEIYFQSADSTNSGMINTGSQTIAGAKTFIGNFIASAGSVISGGTINLNTNSNNDTNINTGTSTGAVTIGGNSLLVKNTNNSSSAFQIQTASGSTVLKADTTGPGGIALLSNNSGEVSTWGTTTAITGSRYGTNSVTANGYVYVIGGTNGTDLATSYYARLESDGTVASWTATTSLPAGRAYATATVSNGYVYVIGGNNSNTSQTSVYYAKLNSDGTIGSWSTTTVLPAARDRATTVTANGYVYVIGGTSDNGATPLNSVYYAKLNSDGTVGSWSTTTTLTAARYNANSVIANGYVYVIGGYNGSTQDTTYYAKLNSDGTIGSWSTTSTLPAPRYGATSIAANGYIYTIGGYNGGSAQSTTYYAKINVNGTVNSWQTATNNLPANRWLASSVTANGYVYVIAGSDGSTPQTTVYYSSLARVQIGGNLDLIGLQGTSLSDAGDQNQGSTGGSIIAGNGTFVGSFQVQGNSSFAQGASINGNLTVNGNATFQNATNSTSAFQIQNAAGTVLLVVDTTNGRIGIKTTSAPAYDLEVNGTLGVNGDLTPVGRLILPSGEISYFSTTGTSITISGTSNGLTNMVPVAVSTSLTSPATGFDNGGSNNGRLRYTGATTRMCHIAAELSASPATTGDSFVFAIAKNGTVVQPSRVLQKLGTTSDNQSVSIHAYTELVTNDYVELYVGNMTASRNIDIKTAQIFCTAM
jgi:N-acetylneuraminic acid mutarotase